MAEYKVIRKIHDQGGSFLVTLPKLWVVANGLRPHDPVVVVFNSELRILPGKAEGERPGT